MTNFIKKEEKLSLVMRRLYEIYHTPVFMCKWADVYTQNKCT